MDTHIEGGICYKICPLCACILAKIDRKTHNLHEFTRNNLANDEMTEVEKSMIEARIRRGKRVDTF